MAESPKGDIKTVKDKVVLISGGAMGMGKFYAEYAVAEGARAVVLWDVNEAVLQETVTELKGRGGLVYGTKVDVTDLDAIERESESFLSVHGTPDVIILNAGIIVGKFFWEHDNRRDTLRTMQVNTLAPMYMARQFLPSMIRDDQRPRRIVMIASSAGFVGNPRMSVYCASKWAAVGWSDSLRIELIKQGHRHIKVTTVCPSYVSTHMFEGAKGMPLAPLITPEYVTAQVWKSFKTGSPLVIRPRTIKIAIFLRALLPVSAFDFLATHVLKIYSTMDNYRPRNPDPTLAARKEL